MQNIQVKELLPEFLSSLPQGSENDAITAFKIIPKYLHWLQKNHNLVLQEPNKSCAHIWEILAQYSITEPHWWDSHPVQKYVVVQICRCGQLRKIKL